MPITVGDAAAHGPGHARRAGRRRPDDGALAAGLRAGAAPGRAARDGAGDAAARARGAHRPGRCSPRSTRPPPGRRGRPAGRRASCSPTTSTAQGHADPTSASCSTGCTPRSTRREAVPDAAAAPGPGGLRRVPRADHGRLHRRRLLRAGRPDRLRQVDRARRDLLRALRHRPALERPARDRQRARAVARRGPGTADLRVGRLPVRGDPGGPPRRQGPGHHHATPAWNSCRPASTWPSSTPASTPSDLGDVLAGTPAEMEHGRAGRGRPAVRAVHQLRRCCRRASSPSSCTPSPRCASRSWSTCSACTSTRRSASRRPRSATQAEAQLSATRPAASPSSPTPATRRSPTRPARLATMTRLAADVDAAVPALAGRQQAAETAQATLRALDGELRALSSRSPRRPASPTSPPRRAAARAAQREAADARRRGRGARGEAARRAGRGRRRHRAAPPARPARRAGPARRPGRPRPTRSLAAADGRARDSRSRRWRGRDRRARRRARRGRRCAEREAEAARTADRAATLRPHLVAGEPCPVCLQPVGDGAAAAATRRAWPPRTRPWPPRRTGRPPPTTVVTRRDRAVRELDAGAGRACGPSATSSTARARRARRPARRRARRRPRCATS